jgi:Flp pilus assembly protein TadG
MTNLSRTLRRLAGETRGSEIAEAAAVLPIMFMILIGIFWFGQAFSIYGTITRAAQEGARAAAAPPCATCATGSTPSTNAYTAIQNVLVVAKLDPTKMQQPTTTPSLVSCTGSTIVVLCDLTPSNVCVQESVQLSSSADSVCGMSVSFQYPYRFWLPFTSLNKQTINLTATARVRLETM